MERPISPKRKAGFGDNPACSVSAPGNARSMVYRLRVHGYNYTPPVAP
ncbi:unnamed protein product [Ectocarpus sp. CCAP 1310/34]|nr:unnamed protein product [Ectocarpus sp. CCAP 1310/34]